MGDSTKHGDGSRAETLAAEATLAPGGVASQGPVRSEGPTLLAGRYEILGLLGAGGMGTVYKARDRELDEIVALKSLRRELVDAPVMLERFRREVKLARRVTHPNVARVFDIGETGAGEKFLTMEFIEGESLATLLGRTGALPIPRAIDLGCAILAGLGAAHAAGVIHRDLKPDNVMLGQDGRVVVTDFGIARAAASEGAVQTMGVLLGTPAYMAPEQVEGAADIDGRADIYAFGALMFELFTGARPWGGDAPIAVAAARLVHPPPDPRKRRPDLPTACAELILKCLARSREDRYPDAAAIASVLSSVTLPVLSVSPASALAPVRAGASVAMTRPPSSERTVAVLPFRNGGAPADGYVADELTDDLIDTLSMTPRLRVRARGAVHKFASGAHDAREVGRELGVQVVVEGSVRKVGGNVRVSARAISVDDGFQLWAKRFDRPEQEVLVVNDEVARAVAAALTVELEAPARAAPSDAAAIDLYLRGRRAYRKFWPEPMAEAVQLFDEALAIAPDDPVILSANAQARSRLAFFTGEGLAEALVVAERAVAVAPNLGEANLALANVVLQSGDPAGAIRALKVSVARGPGVAEAHALLGRMLVELGDLDAGMARLDAALALDRDAPLTNVILARTHALAGRWEKVDACIAAAMESEAEGGASTLSARMVLWRRDRALAERRHAETIGARDALVPLAILDLARSGDITRVSGLMTTLVIPPPSAADRRRPTAMRQAFFLQMVAESWAYVGDDERTLDAIEHSIDAGLYDLAWLDACPLFSPALRESPRFAAASTRLRARAEEILTAYRTG